MAEAAERRIQQSDSRGLQDPEGFKRKQEAKRKAEEEAGLRSNQEPALKVSLWKMSLSLRQHNFCSSGMSLKKVFNNQH